MHVCVAVGVVGDGGRPRFLRRSPAESRTHDLFITSPTLCHSAIHEANYVQMYVHAVTCRLTA